MFFQKGCKGVRKISKQVKEDSIILESLLTFLFCSAFPTVSAKREINQKVKVVSKGVKVKLYTSYPTAQVGKYFLQESPVR